VPTLPVEAFDRVRTPYAYDAIVYALGVRSDPQVLDLARQTAGVVWLRKADGIVEIDPDLVAGARAVVATRADDGREPDELARALVAAARTSVRAAR
jgi:hypothetical protein